MKLPACPGRDRPTACTTSHARKTAEAAPALHPSNAGAGRTGKMGAVPLLDQLEILGRDALDAVDVQEGRRDRDGPAGRRLLDDRAVPIVDHSVIGDVPRQHVEPTPV